MALMTRFWKTWRSKPADAPQLEYLGSDWSIAQQRLQGGGWNAESVVEIQSESLADWQRAQVSTAPLGSAHGSAEARLSLHNTLVSFAYVAALASQRGKLSLLDWGGGAGQYGWLAQGVLPGIAVEYFCKDVPVQCAAGRSTFPHGTFFTSDDQYQGHRFDLVCASGSLNYAEDWVQVLRRLTAATGRYLYVTRLPIVQHVQSYVVLQRAYRSQYLGWTLNRDHFLSAADACGLQLIREFLVGERQRARGAPAASQSCGFLFRPTIEPSGG